MYGVDNNITISVCHWCYVRACVTVVIPLLYYIKYEACKADPGSRRHHLRAVSLLLRAPARARRDLRTRQPSCHSKEQQQQQQRRAVAGADGHRAAKDVGTSRYPAHAEADLKLTERSVPAALRHTLCTRCPETHAPHPLPWDTRSAPATLRHTLLTRFPETHAPHPLPWDTRSAPASLRHTLLTRCPETHALHPLPWESSYCLRHAGLFGSRGDSPSLQSHGTHVIF